MFSVPGIPQTAGSKRAFPFRRRDGTLGATVTDDNPNGKDWKRAVAWTAKEALSKENIRTLFDGPIRFALIFELPRPRSHFGKRGLLPSARAWPTVKPDVLKLARAVEDALTGIAWRDDAQIVHEQLTKKYGERAVMHVLIEEVA